MEDERFRQGNTYTYSHTFHIALNSFLDRNNLPNYCKIFIKIDTIINRNQILFQELKESFLGLLEIKISKNGIFNHQRNINNLPTNFFSQTSISRGIKEDVKNVCEKLLIDISYFHSHSYAIFSKHNNFNMRRIQGVK